MLKEHKVSELALPQIAQMSAYVPGLQCNELGWVKLNTNEAPYPPSPRVAAAICAYLGEDGERLRRYPEPLSSALRGALAKHHGLLAENFIIGNGADDVLNMLCRVFLDKKRVLGNTSPSYGLYPILSAIQGAEILDCCFDASFALPIEAIVKSPAPLFFLTSPNAPSGRCFTQDEIRQVLAGYKGILVLDETYAPFADWSAVDLLEEFSNLVIVRSFSKAYALAGMRLGYAMASAEIIELLDRVRDSYNVDCLAQVAGLATIEDSSYYQKKIADLKALRQRIEARYRSFGWSIYESSTNFHLLRPQTRSGVHGAKIAKDLFLYLENAKILTRYFPQHELTASHLRVSMGSEAEMEILLDCIEQWLKK